MRFILCICLFFTCISSVMGKKKDTIFLKKVYNAEQQLFNKVYINPNSNSWHYERLSNFGSIRKNKIEKPSHFPFGKWISLHQYKNNFYTYFPCDWGTLLRLEIDANKYTEHSFEEEEWQIKSIRAVSKRKYVLDIEYSVSKTYRKIIFYLVDDKKGIAVLEYMGSTGDRKYQLLIKNSNINKIPMIINECNSKAIEFQFDAINYISLLNNIGYYNSN